MRLLLGLSLKLRPIDPWGNAFFLCLDSLLPGFEVLSPQFVRLERVF